MKKRYIPPKIVDSSPLEFLELDGLFRRMTGLSSMIPPTVKMVRYANLVQEMLVELAVREAELTGRLGRA